MTHRRAFALLALIVLLIAGLLLIFQLQLFKLRSPGAPHSQNNLNGVAAVSANDIWAVGYYSQASGATQTLIEHWDGKSWSVIPSPKVGTRDSNLNGVAAVSANDVWAVGLYSDSGARQTLAEHWNGKSWSMVSGPNVGTNDNNFNGVAAVSANDVWAVGLYSQVSGANRTLAEHWNGKSWSVVSSPNPGTNDNNFYGVAAVSANDVWAVGYYGTSQTLIEHWDGKSWSVVSSPNVGTSNNYPRGVAAVSANDVWAVGYYDNGASQTFVEHWNGKSWSKVPMPSPNQ